MARRKGTAGDDALNGSDNDDRIIGFAGNDVLSGGRGGDRLVPGTGSDTLFGEFGNDIAVITELDYTTPDTFDGGSGYDTVNLGGVRPLTSYDSTYWSFDSQTGVFTVQRFGDPYDAPRALTFSNVEHLVGTSFDDTMVLVSSTTNMTIDAGAGDDWVRAGGGNVTVHAGSGDDRIDFGYGRIAFYGDAGDDVIHVGSATRGLADGGNGIDTISAGGNINLEAGFAMTYGGRRIAIDRFENVSLGGASDGAVARGDEGDNVMTGDLWPSDFVFYGLRGNDTIVGGDGADRLAGGDGDDVLDGAFGADTLIGRAGADVFRFDDDFFSRAVETDTITDFKRRQGDRIDVSGIDADPNTFVDDPLRFRGAAAFEGRVGELRYEVRGADTFIQVDRDGDAAADFEIRLAGVFELRPGDFIFVANAASDFGATPHHPAVVSPELVAG